MRWVSVICDMDRRKVLSRNAEMARPWISPHSMKVDTVMRGSKTATRSCGTNVKFSAMRELSVERIRAGVSAEIQSCNWSNIVFIYSHVMLTLMEIELPSGESKDRRAVEAFTTTAVKFPTGS